MSRIEAFLTLINEKYFQSSKSLELQELWKSTEEEKIVCDFIMTQGKRKGEACGKEHCLLHVKKVECNFIMKSGLRKGQPCEKACKTHPTLCETHKKNESKTDAKSDTKTESKTNETNSEEQSETDKKEDKKEETCKMVLKTGVNKGKTCGKKSVGMYCTIHDKKEVKKEKTCNVEISNTGEPCGKACESGKETCSIHETIRVKKFGNYYIIKDTNVLFNLETKSAIGYVNDGDCVFKQNEHVKQVCERFHIEFSSM